MASCQGIEGTEGIRGQWQPEVGMTDGHLEEVELQQGSALSPFLVCNGDGQVGRRDRTGVSTDYDMDVM